MTDLSAVEQFDTVIKISGWFYLEDAIILHAINTIQCESKIHGDLLEVGVYQGKSAAFLGFFVGSKERLVVCGTFEHEAMDVDNLAENTRGIPISTGESLKKITSRSTTVCRRSWLAILRSFGGQPVFIGPFALSI